MKKILYTFIFSAGCLALFLNNSNGRASDSGVGNTGAPGDAPVTCQDCHSAGAFGPPSMTVELFDSTNTTRLTAYRPNRLHVVRVTITATGVPAAGGYGFQMIDIRKLTNTPVGGILATNQQTIGTNVKATTLASTTRTYAEHRSGKSSSNVFNVRWRAPAIGTGPVEFYAAGNAVNGTGTQSGDGAANTKLDMPEGTTSTNDLSDKVQFTLGPNPVHDQLTLRVNSQRDHSLQVAIVNIAGQTVLAEKWQIGAGENTRTLQLGKFQRGAYLIQITDNQETIAKKVFKL
jgi:hypothetical protein